MSESINKIIKRL